MPITLDIGTDTSCGLSRGSPTYLPRLTENVGGVRETGCMSIRRVVAALAALCVIVLAAGCTPAATDVTRTRVAGVQLFMWPWESIGKECTENLGPNQYAFVLTSPPQEHIQGDAWWTNYQPVSYKVESRFGTREQFKAMVDACHAAGVKVIADAVVNHMAGVDGGTGFAGSTFTHYEYPGIYTRDDFHSCGTVDDDIHNYQSQFEVQNCELVNLADLKTESTHVRETLTAYLKGLQSLGVDGFRIDAAKHMPAADVEGVVSGLSGNPVIISEVIRGAGEPIQPEQYLKAGGVFAFAFARELKGLADRSSIGRVTALQDGSVPSDKAYTFVTNHDTERNGQTLTYKDGQRFVLGTALAVGSAYGTPLLYSGYAFEGHDMGPTLSPSGAVVPVTCASDTGPTTAYTPRQWVCEHRWPGMAGLVDWRSVVGSEPVANEFTQGDAVAFDRGKLGFIAMTNGSEPVELTATTGLPDGSYCNVMTAPTLASGEKRCPTGDVMVTGGKVTVTVPAKGVVAIHVGLRQG